MHSGYGFAIGNVAAFDMADPQAVVSPGGVGFDINCGVRLIRTNLVRSCTARHQECKKQPFATAMFFPFCLFEVGSCSYHSPLPLVV